MQVSRLIPSWPSFSLLFPIAVACLLSSPFPVGAQKTALRLDGRAADPFQEASGKPVVFVFVRTDCPVSNRYAPLIQKIGANYGGKVGFWLVYLGKTASAKEIRLHKREFHYELPALRDPHHVLVRQAQVQITPEAAVFDVHRRLVYHGRIDNLYEDVGRTRPAATTHDLDDAIEAALSGKTPPPNTPGVGCFIADTE